MVAYDVKIAEQPPAHYGYDPHLSPQLVWAGKPGLVNIEVEDAAGLAVDTVFSLHIHERISTQAMIHAVQRPQAVQAAGDRPHHCRRRAAGDPLRPAAGG
jgi:adenine-specific DNA-methyltransferase